LVSVIVKPPRKSPKDNDELPEDWYWPLAGLEYAIEIREFFSSEAELIGTITILWNRQELALRQVFLNILEPRIKSFGEAIWDRQPTHKSKRDLLTLAMDNTKLNHRQKAILNYIIEKTKNLADRRNQLIHAEYVVHGRTNILHGKIKSPRSTKPPKYQKLSPKDLTSVVVELEGLLGITEYNEFEFLGPEPRIHHDKLMKDLTESARSLKNQQAD